MYVPVLIACQRVSRNFAMLCDDDYEYSLVIPQTPLAQSPTSTSMPLQENLSPGLCDRRGCQWSLRTPTTIVPSCLQDKSATCKPGSTYKVVKSLPSIQHMSQVLGSQAAPWLSAEHPPTSICPPCTAHRYERTSSRDRCKCGSYQHEGGRTLTLLSNA